LVKDSHSCIRTSIGTHPAHSPNHHPLGSLT
jgi:hypothetical protein